MPQPAALQEVANYLTAPKLQVHLLIDPTLSDPGLQMFESLLASELKDQNLSSSVDPVQTDSSDRPITLLSIDLRLIF